jgi:hypothetical protein
MVDGLDGEKTPSWEGGDFATIVHQLKLLGFNAVRLPFLFGNLYTLPPQVRGPSICRVLGGCFGVLVSVCMPATAATSLACFVCTATASKGARLEALQICVLAAAVSVDASLAGASTGRITDAMPLLQLGRITEGMPLQLQLRNQVCPD